MRGKNPTVRQKRIISSWGLNYTNWLICGVTDKLKLVHRNTGNKRIIPNKMKGECGE